MSILDDLGCALVAPWDRSCVNRRVSLAVLAGATAVAHSGNTPPVTHSTSWLGGIIDSAGGAVARTEDAATAPLHELSNTVMWSVIGIGLILLIAITVVIWWVIK